MNLLWAIVFNFVSLDILWYSIEHPSKKLLSFNFAQSFYSEFRASRYITRHNRTSELKVMVVWISWENFFSILSVSIYYETQSDIRVKGYCRLNLLRDSKFNFEHLDILLDSITHLCKKLLSFEFAQSFGIQFQVSRYIKWLNPTSE